MKNGVTNILWTSGWDSTFRLAELVLIKGKTVQPYYVLDERRPSSRIELQKMEEIKQLLITKDSSTRNKILPTIMSRASQVPPNEQVSKSLQVLKQQSHIGDQYDFLARFALHHNIRNLELSIHKDDMAHGFLKDYVHSFSDKEGNVSYEMSKESCPVELHVIFSHFSFPVFEKTKLEMDAYAHQNDFQDIMEITWFCHKPLLNNKPCGFCRPCQYTRQEGLGRRVPDATIGARLEYHYARAIRKIKSVFKVSLYS